MNDLIPSEQTITNKTFFIRGEQIIIDKDLAELYETKTHALNQAVKRNIKRFPPDFMFELTEKEKTELITNCDRLNSLKFSNSPIKAFTRDGVLMASNILQSTIAIEVSIEIVRVFRKLQKKLTQTNTISQEISELRKELHSGLEEQKIWTKDKLEKVADAISLLEEMIIDINSSNQSKKMGFLQSEDSKE